MAQETAAVLLEDLSPREASGLADYLTSPDFEQVALQLVITELSVGGGAREEHVSAVREQLRHGLRLAAGVPVEGLLGLTDVVLDQLRAVAHSSAGSTATEALAAQGHLTAAAARNGVLLSRLPELSRIHAESARLRSQVASVHGDLRMPHNGKVRSVPWDQLYVAPSLHLDAPQETVVVIDELVDPGRRHVILGDPGAGKSTLAAKLAHDLAADPDGTVVPLLVVLRHFSAALEAGDRTLVEHLVSVAKDPYNVSLTTDTVEYLLMNGRAVVILDGLDELTDISLRSRVADLVKGFVLLYPLVPVIATSRRVGYAQAALDATLFRTCVLAAFDAERVESYVRRWFRLDDGLPPVERDRLASAFLRESERIDDLRSSPLLLSVLCSMYATDHFIPRNRGQIYERCALMVFEQWDQMRGISRALGFEGRVRSAVQDLAWTLLTRHKVPEQPRSRIKAALERHLTGKGFDEDQAAAVATEFLDYCAGRAWILVEVGSTATEPIFGFSHRTSLEYFAAEHLVRRARTPAKVWKQLAPHVRRNQWEVVAQLALQLIDRNVDDGGDAALRLALDDVDRVTAQDERDALLAFCARALGDVCVTPEVTCRVVDLAVSRSCAFQEADRFQVMPTVPWALGVADGPLYALLFQSLPGNLTFIRRRLAEAFGDRLEADDDVAHFILSVLSRRLLTEDQERAAVWAELQEELKERHELAHERWRHRRPWAQLRDAGALSDVIANYGALPLYVSDMALSGAGYPWVVGLLVDDIGVAPDQSHPLKETAHLVREQLIAHAVPWLPPFQAESSFTFRRIEEEPVPPSGEDLSSHLVLSLPYLEARVPPTQPIHVFDLARAGRDGDEQAQKAFERELDKRAVPLHVREFLVRWVQGLVSVVGDAGPT
ncbi:NACHT domain-containing protein [Micromonospora sediminicola]|uniref:NACHT domain-containing protein n=1 Tax=Micromonospora sediminicola TaxID=946078 RepID=A0A1A9B957_9ACTN|nr:NACHT domain-containing protein [Micromonospora sediminicola]SBT65673.1 NACHT domain-containing protein [Micromonospora sediminicola]